MVGAGSQQEGRCPGCISCLCCEFCGHGCVLLSDSGAVCCPAGGRWAIGPAVAWRGPRGAVLEEKLGRPNPGSCPRGRQGHHPLRAQLTHGNRRPGSCHRPAGQEKHRLLPPIHSPVVSSAGEVDSGLRDRKEAERRALVARSPSEPASPGRPLDAPAPEALLTGGGSPAPTG